MVDMADQGIGDPTEYLVDPSQHRDDLPQPYRLIEKILNNIIDNAWEIMTKLAVEQLRQTLRYRALQYNSCQQLQEHQCVNCLAVSCDNRYVFIGHMNGLTAIDGTTSETKAVWTDDTANICSVSVSTFAFSAYMITTTDSLGVVRLLMFGRDSLLFVMAKLNPSTEETKDNRSTSVVSSHHSHYVGIFTINNGDAPGSIDIFQLPKEVWTKELETFLGGPLAMIQQAETTEPVEPEPSGAPNARQKTTTSGVAVPPSKLKTATSGASVPPGKQKTATAGASVPPAKLKTATSGVAASPAKPSDGEQIIGEAPKPPPDFTLPTAILKINQPQERKGCTWTSPYGALKAVNTLAEFLPGTSLPHLLSEGHLDRRRTMFARMRNLQPITRMVWVDDTVEETLPSTPDIHIPTIHFLVPVTACGQPVSSGDACTLPPALALWWSGHREVLVYILTKAVPTSSKGAATAVAERQPDHAWPVSGVILISAQSACNMVLALALDNNSVMVWDRLLGSFSYSKIEDAGQIVKLSFIENVACTTDWGKWTSLVGHGHCLLAQCVGGRLYLVQAGAESWTTLVIDEIECEDEITTLIRPLYGHPKLALMNKQDGSLVIHDTGSCLPLFEVLLPSSYSLHSAPTSAVAVTNACAQLLYIIGAAYREAIICVDSGGKNDTENVDSGNNDTEKKEKVPMSTVAMEQSLFIFDMAALLPPRYLPICCFQLTAAEDIEESSNSSTVDKSLCCRLVNQEERKMRLHQNWFQLKQRLTLS